MHGLESDVINTCSVVLASSHHLLNEPHSHQFVIGPPACLWKNQAARLATILPPSRFRSIPCNNNNSMEAWMAIGALVRIFLLVATCPGRAPAFCSPKRFETANGRMMYSAFRTQAGDPSSHAASRRCKPQQHLRMLMQSMPLLCAFVLVAPGTTANRCQSGRAITGA